MKERVGTRFICALIYVLICVRWLIPEHGNQVCLEMLPSYLLMASLFTILLECWYYLMVDLLKQFKYVSTLILIISSIWLYFDYSAYLLCGLVYLVFVMLKDYYLAYSMSKLVYEFNAKEE